VVVRNHCIVFVTSSAFNIYLMYFETSAVWCAIKFWYVVMMVHRDRDGIYRFTQHDLRVKSSYPVS
jgi:hypothetical protein